MEYGMLQHVHLFCTDLNAAIDFWVKGFGATFLEFRKFGNDDGAVLDMKSATQLFLKVAPGPKQHGSVDHLGVYVESLEKSLKILLAMPGVTLTREAFVSGTRLCAFIKNADEVSIELLQPDYTEAT